MLSFKYQVLISFLVLACVTVHTTYGMFIFGEFSRKNFITCDINLLASYSLVLIYECPILESLRESSSIAKRSLVDQNL